MRRERRGNNPGLPTRPPDATVPDAEAESRAGSRSGFLGSGAAALVAGAAGVGFAGPRPGRVRRLGVALAGSASSGCYSSRRDDDVAPDAGGRPACVWRRTRMPTSDHASAHRSTWGRAFATTPTRAARSTSGRACEPPIDVGPCLSAPAVDAADGTGELPICPPDPATSASGRRSTGASSSVPAAGRRRLGAARPRARRAAASRRRRRAQPRAARSAAQAGRARLAAPFFDEGPKPVLRGHPRCAHRCYYCYNVWKEPDAGVDHARAAARRVVRIARAARFATRAPATSRSPVASRWPVATRSTCWPPRSASPAPSR